MNMATIGAITIGQSPRVDIIPELQELVGPSVVFHEMGALDGLAREQIIAMQPSGNDEVLVTRMRDGTSVTISDDAAIPRIQACIQRLQSHVSAIVILCTGTFPVITAKVPVLVPEYLLLNFVRGMAGTGLLKLGVLTPTKAQFKQQQSRWQDVVSEVVLRAASPYDGVEAVLAEGRSFKEDGVDAVVLDCMGYTSEMKAALRRELPCPVILARAVVGRFAAELA